MLQCARIVTAFFLIVAAVSHNVDGRSLHQFTTVQSPGGSFSSDGTPNPSNPAIDALLDAILDGFEDDVAADIARGRPVSRGRPGESSTVDKPKDEVEKDKTGELENNGDTEKPGEPVETTKVMETVETVEAGEATETGGAAAAAVQTVQTVEVVQTVQTVQTVPAPPSGP